MSSAKNSNQLSRSPRLKAAAAFTRKQHRAGWNRFDEMTTLGGRAREGTIALDDGRALGYAEYGEPGGAPILYLHGMPGSRLDPALLDEEYRRIGVREVAIERPGYGLSTARRAWGLLAWPADLAGA